MFPCPVCKPYGGPPGTVPVVLPRTEEERARGIPPVTIWVLCDHCHGAVASCCDQAGAAGNE